MRPRMVFLNWLDVWAVDREELVQPRECFEGYGFIIKQVFIVYLRLCALAGADSRDFS